MQQIEKMLAKLEKKKTKKSIVKNPRPSQALVIEFRKQIGEENYQKLLQHLEGEVYLSSAKTVGGHSSVAVRNGKIKIIPGTKVPPKPKINQAYKAKIKIKGKNGQYYNKRNNGGFASLFPENWSQQRMMEEIAFAFKNKKALSNIKYKGKSTNGIDIIFIIKNGIIKTVYPI